MTKVLILGDTHGEIKDAINAVDKAVELGIDTILQVGDFGLWDKRYDGVEFLDKLNRAALDANVVVIWVDGNHEDHDRLDWYVKNNPKTTNGHVFIRTNILYSPRGLMWKMHGRTFMSVGGAVSVDKEWRLNKEGRSQARTLWWPQEQLTDAQLDGILEKHKTSRVDVLLTHDCPSNALFGQRLKNDHESLMHRQRMDRLGNAIKPKLWFHGHMHTKYDGYMFPTYESTTTVYGLDRDGSPWNMGVLDTDNMTFNWTHNPDSLFYKNLDKAEPPGEWVEWDDDGWMK